MLLCDEADRYLDNQIIMSFIIIIIRCAQYRWRSLNANLLEIFANVEIGDDIMMTLCYSVGDKKATAAHNLLSVLSLCEN